MKVMYAKFVNFAGIFAGLGVKEVELDFKKSKNRFIMLLGGNGSGKTTMMSLLHPLRGSNDERKNLILEGENGLKEIHLKDDKDEYVIVHHYGSKNKSFISKNGKELNENGGIKTFDQCIKDEVNLGKDYFRIGRLGSNVNTFINMKTSERKSYMHNFLPNIDEYLEAFEIVKEKFTEVKSTMKSISGQLDKLDSKDNMELSLKSSNEKIEEIRKSIKENEKTVLSKSFTINNILKELGYGELLFLEQDLQTISKKVKSEEKELVQFYAFKDNAYNKHPELKEFSLEKLQKLLAETTERLINYKTALDDKNKDLQSIQENIFKIDNSLKKKKSSLNDEIDIDSLRETINNRKEGLSVLTNKLNSNSYKDLNVPLNEISNYSNLVSQIKDGVETLINKTNSHVIDAITIDIVTSYINDAENYLVKLENSSNRINQLREEINHINSNNYLLETLSNRPSDCVIDTCPFIVKALDYKNNDYSRLEDLKTNLEMEIKNKETIEREITYRKEFIDYMKELNAFSYKMKNNELIKEFIVKDETPTEVLLRVAKYGISNLNKVFNTNEIMESVTIKSNIENEESRIRELENNLELHEKQKILLDNIREEIKDLELELNSEKNKMIEIKKDIEDFTNKINKSSYKIEIFNSLISILNQEEDKKEELEKYKNKEKELSHKKDIIDRENSIIKIINETLKNQKLEEKNLESKINETRANLTILERYTEDLENVKKNFDTYSLIKDALDPKKGIPLFFIDNYLKDISIRINNLLSIAYGNQFKIKFDINSSDFFVNVLKSDGTQLKDIVEASQGEVSLTTISLSLGMIERLMETTRYNILYLDEIDGALSTENRRLFLSLLDDQIKKLGIEQVFIISHNSEFHSSSSDLILLNGNDIDVNDKEFMSNKNIIFSV
ncbi:hypothetical protein Bp8pS_208 [Bacillus phage vB_BpuM-BpSp]|nr:hypothetical protein Bp8pS_208 [Bacillus phage vB_BpuM-BpSp]